MAFYQRKPDMIIRGGTIIDGTGSPRYYADIAIIGDKIDYIGDLRGVEAPVDIDATGKFVTPGFIDCHTHADYNIFCNPECHSSVRQGVTTEVVGNCGFSMRGFAKQHVELMDSAGDGVDCVYNLPGPTYPKGAVAATLDRMEKMGASMNTAWQCGHNDLRVMAQLTTPECTEEQFRIMADFLREAMEAGFIGFSTGLEFAPGSVAKPEEVERLAAIAAEYDGIYTSHMRDEGYYLFEAIEEFLNVLRKTGMRGSISHLNVKYDNGIPNDYWEKAMDMLRNAREKEHLNVMTDMLPTCFATGGAMAMLPPWLYAEGWEQARQTLADPEGREKVKNDLDRYWRFLAAGQWDRLLYVQTPHLPHLAGKPFAQIVEESGKEPVDVFLDLIMACQSIEQAYNVKIQGNVFFEQTMIDRVIKDPLYLWMTDSHVTMEEGTLAEMTPNLQDYMSTFYFLIRYVRELQVISLEDAIKKMGLLPARHFRIENRGVLAEGNFADINVFDLDKLTINAKFGDVHHYSTGMDYVIVNGVPVIVKDQHTGQRAGRVLRRLPKK